MPTAAPRPVLPARPLLVALGAAALALSTAACGSDAEPASGGTPAGQSPAGQDAAGQDTAGAFTAGTYTADGEYQNPDGPASVGVEVVLDAAGTIESVEVTPHSTGGNGALFQKLFADNIADVVVGKPVEEADVDKVAGSSLTGAGFNAALDAIIAQASA